MATRTQCLIAGFLDARLVAESRTRIHDDHLGHERNRNGHKSDRAPRRQFALFAFAATMALSSAASAHGPPRNRGLPPDGVLWTPAALLREFFPSSERVAYERVRLSLEAQAELRKLTSVKQVADTHIVFVARTGTRIDGYAFLSGADSGKSPATFGIKLGVTGRVGRAAVMRLFDPYQQDILDPRFLHQFDGSTLREAPRLHRDVEKPRRCTSACSAAIEAVRRALFLVSQLQPDNVSPVSPVSNE